MDKKQFRAMPFGKKITFCLKKYGWEVIFSVYLICLLGSWVYADYIAEQPMLRVEMIDGALESPNSEAFRPFMTEQGRPCTDQSVCVSKKIQLGNEAHDLKCSPDALLFCRVASGKTDLYFWNDPHTEEHLAFQDLVDLRTVLPSHVLEQCQDRLIYTGPLLEGGYPCGIHLKDCDWVKQNGFYQDCAVGISRNAMDQQLVNAFIEYII